MESVHVDSMTRSKTLMQAETAEIPAVAARQFLETATAFRDLGALLRQNPPRFVMTCARGSSDHAANFAKYAIETRLGIPVASHAPSTSSVFGVQLRNLEGTLFLAISQSGKSPDILASIAMAQEAGAFVVALVNDVQSPAASLADLVIPLCAGPELAVAATKSFLASLLAVVHLVAEWAQDVNLDRALEQAPDMLARALAQDWSAGLTPFIAATHGFVIGRGLTFGIAHEAALKLKETSALHGEAYSAAEVRHGPMAIIGAGFPVLMFVPNDPTRGSFAALCAEFEGRGAALVMAGGDSASGIILPGDRDGHPLLTPLAQITSFYLFANQLAALRGHDPDAPPGLNKVTQTR